MSGQDQASSIVKWLSIGGEKHLASLEAGPFYLKIEFEVYDLDGKNPEVGTLEEWVSGSRVKKVISSPSWNYPPMAGQQLPKNRNAYLIQNLLWAFVGKKVPPRVSTTEIVTESERKFGPVILDCLALQSQYGTDHTTCLDTETSIWRLDESSVSSVVRDHIAQFRGISVPMSASVFFDGLPAIQGKITDLHGIETTDPHLPPESPAVDDSNGGELQTAGSGDGKSKNSGDIQLPPSVVAGSIMSKTPPKYPEDARMRHIGGTVVLQAVIDKTGNVTSLVVIASPDPSLSQAARDAVSKWRYKPSLRNGEPTEVDTQILVNFNLNSH